MGGTRYIRMDSSGFMQFKGVFAGPDPSCLVNVPNHLACRSLVLAIDRATVLRTNSHHDSFPAANEWIFINLWVFFTTMSSNRRGKLAETAAAAALIVQNAPHLMAISNLKLFLLFWKWRNTKKYSNAPFCTFFYAMLLLLLLYNNNGAIFRLYEKLLSMSLPVNDTNWERCVCHACAEKGAPPRYYQVISLATITHLLCYCYFAHHF